MRFLPIILAMMLVGVVAGSGALLLKSCGLRLPFFSVALSICDDGATQSAASRIATLEEGRSALLREIAALERGLATTQCEVTAPEPPRERADLMPPPQFDMPPPQFDAPPARPSDPEGLDRDSFESRDISVLDGCWDLDSDYRTRNVDTGAITDYTRWHMCFDQTGRGTQTMQATDGTTCQGPVEGRFDEAGRLIMDDGTPVQCSNGGTIFRRVITCELDDTGRADCLSRQPFDGRGGAAEVGLRRAGGDL